MRIWLHNLFLSLCLLARFIAYSIKETMILSPMLLCLRNYDSISDVIVPYTATGGYNLLTILTRILFAA